MKFADGMYLKYTLQNNSGDLLDAAVKIDVIKGQDVGAIAFEKNGDRGLVASRFRIDLNNASRVKIKVGSAVWVDGEPAVLVAHSKRRSSKDHYMYWCRVKNKITVVSEKRINAACIDYEKSTQEIFLENDDNSLDDFFSRYEINDYLNKLNSITSGYKDALDKKINLYAHQIETVQKILSGRPYRAILADEVGLGKTIEALVVLNYLMKKSVCRTALIVVPDQLIYQWKNEAKERFGLEVSVFSVANYLKGREKCPIVLVGFSNFVRYGEDYILHKEWGITIIDEVHKTLGNNKIYTKLLKLCGKVPNHLLLSATPIMKRNLEYYRLLKLLYPEIYSNIDISKFTEMMRIKELIEGDLAGLASDIRYAFDDEVLGEYIDRLKTIAEDISDFKLIEYLQSVDEDSSDVKRKKIKRAVLYLQKAYEIESKFIRHRRSDILDNSSKRVLNNCIGFYLKGEEKLSEEANLYQCFTDEIQNNSSIDGDIIINIVNAFFSSAAALNRELIYSDLYKVFPNTNKIAHFESIKEKKTLSNSRIEELLKNLRNYTGSEKIVIFSDFDESVNLIYKRLLVEYGDTKVILFTGSDSEARMQIAVNNFVNNSSIKFMVCDKNGAEGRNFQFADVLVHYDLPWSPARLEQRIGRLDRIGRKPGRKVYNDVLYVRDSVEEDLFNLYNDCLDVFNESLCGIEIIFDELWSAICETISERGLFGFSYVNDLVSELKEKCSQVLFEEMLDLECLEESDNSFNNARQAVGMFTNVEKKKFYDAIFKWHYNSGYGYKEAIAVGEDSYRVSGLQVDARTAGKRNYYPLINTDIFATYNLEKIEAVEKLELLSLDHNLVKAVMQSVASTDIGVRAAVKIDSQGVRWRGFVITWQPKFYELDNMVSLWSSVNAAIKNDYINKTRISIPYEIDSESYFVEELFEYVKVNNVRLLDIDEVSEELDYADVGLCLSKAIEATKETYVELLKNQIDYEGLEQKISSLTEENDVNQMIGRMSDKTSRFLDVHKAIRLMLTNFDVEIDSIMFISIDKE